MGQTPTDSLFKPGRNCWRVARADRVSLLLDNSAYFAVALEAIRNARRSIHLLGWGFDPRTRLWPEDADAEDPADEVGKVLRAAVEANPELDVRLLIWKSALPVSISQEFFPHRSKAWFRGSRVRFLLDDAVPFGACHHQKVLIIDGKLAFCGGGDICVDRWDSPAHLDRQPRRLMPNGKCHAPRHEVMAMVDGEAARALAEMFRDRWLAASGVKPPPLPEADDGYDPWPKRDAPELTDVDIAIARTLPGWRRRPEVREIEALHLDAIVRARRMIYLENQYFTSPVIAEALARRLTEPGGPEVVLISTAHSPSYFDQATMDQTRSQAIRRLTASDFYGRFRAFCPRTREGEPVIVHSKVAIIDDQVLRIGSANLNNRSAGFDSECDLAIEATTPAHAAAIARFRGRLIGHFAGRAPSLVDEEIKARGLIAAVEAARVASQGRLEALTPRPLDPVSGFIADHHLGDPLDPFDAWRPFLRRRRMQKRLAQLGRRLAAPAPAVDVKVDDKR